MMSSPTSSSISSSGSSGVLSGWNSCAAVCVAGTPPSTISIGFVVSLPPIDFRVKVLLRAKALSASASRWARFVFAATSKTNAPTMPAAETRIHSIQANVIALAYSAVWPSGCAVTAITTTNPPANERKSSTPESTATKPRCLT